MAQRELVMIEEEIPESEPPSQRLRPVNDNDGEAAGGIDARILIIARAIGRQIAREQLSKLGAANDNEALEQQ
jgi:hypothetical protein